MKRFFTSECVTPGHPDKVADIISDGILDRCLYYESGDLSRVAAETMVARNNVVLAGEISSFCKKDEIEEYVVKCVEHIGYTYPDMQFRADNLNIINLIAPQSEDIANMVNISMDKVGAGDQGIMFGAATRRYDKLTYMPIEWRIARNLANRLYTTFLNNRDIYRPDGKTQVTCSYDENGNVSVEKIIVSFQHAKMSDEEYAAAKTKIVDEVIMKTLKEDFYWLECSKCQFSVNLNGQFVLGGPDADTGLTGRKIVVDGYGGTYPVGGGAFSGKDPSKVDRSAALMARHIAVSIVESAICQEAIVQLAYEIGCQQPVSLDIKLVDVDEDVIACKGDDKSLSLKLSDTIRNHVDMSPRGIIDYFNLTKGKKLFELGSYSDLAMYGHFGRRELAWEKASMDIVRMCYEL